MVSEIQKKLEKESKEAVAHFKDELGKMRGGRASTGLLESLEVDYYGSSVPLQQLGLINAPEARLLTVQVYDAGAADSIEKAIRSSALGLNPARDGNLIRVPIPALTEERRKDLVKVLHRLAEEIKVSIRNHRRECVDALKEAQKSKKISEDELHRGQEQIQKTTDHYVGEVDQLLAAKEKEMLEI